MNTVKTKTLLVDFPSLFENIARQQRESMLQDHLVKDNLVCVMLIEMISSPFNHAVSCNN